MSDPSALLVGSQLCSYWRRAQTENLQRRVVLRGEIHRAMSTGFHLPCGQEVWVHCMQCKHRLRDLVWIHTQLLALLKNPSIHPALNSYLLCTSSLWNKPVIQAFLFQSVLLQFFINATPPLKVILFIRVGNCGHTRTQVSIVVIRPLALLVARFSLMVS